MHNARHVIYSYNTEVANRGYDTVLSDIVLSVLNGT